MKEDEILNLNRISVRVTTLTSDVPFYQALNNDSYAAIGSCQNLSGIIYAVMTIDYSVRFQQLTFYLILVCFFDITNYLNFNRKNMSIRAFGALIYRGLDVLRY